MYGKRKVIAKRKPLVPSSRGCDPGSKAGSSTTRAFSSITNPATPNPSAYLDHEEQEQLRDVLSTPTATEGETATETEPEMTGTEMDDRIPTQAQPQLLMMNHNDILPGRHSTQKKLQTPPVPLKSRHQPQASISSITSVSSDAGVDNRTKKKRGLSQHDLLNRYFRRDAVVLRNIDLLRYGY